MPNDQNGNNIENLTIKDMFDLSPDTVELAGSIHDADFQQILKRISSLPQPIPWSRVQEEVASVVPNMLNAGLLETWASAWEKYQGLRNDVEESRRNPEGIVLSPLAEHSIDSTLHPFVEVFLGPQKIGEIEFDVTLTTHLKGLVLGLKNANLVSLQLAQCEWTGTIATHGAVLLQRKLKKLDFPGRIVLKRSISLSSKTN